MIIFSTCRLDPICKQTVPVVLLNFLLFSPFLNPPFLIWGTVALLSSPTQQFLAESLYPPRYDCVWGYWHIRLFLYLFLFLFTLSLFFPSLRLRCCRLVHVALVKVWEFRAISTICLLIGQCLLYCAFLSGGRRIATFSTKLPLRFELKD